jgi:hypothetical protein
VIERLGLEQRLGWMQENVVVECSRHVPCPPVSSRT